MADGFARIVGQRHGGVGEPGVLRFAPVEAARGSHESSSELSAGCQSGGLEVAVDGERILVLDRVSASVKVFAAA